MTSLQTTLEPARVRKFITAVICLAIFVVELVLKLLVSRLRFFRDGWNIHDFARGFSGTALAPGG